MVGTDSLTVWGAATTVPAIRKSARDRQIFFMGCLSVKPVGDEWEHQRHGDQEDEGPCAGGTRAE